MSRSSGLRRERTAFELVVLGVAAAAIASIVGALVAFGAGAASGPPDLHVVLEPSGAGRHTLSVTNRGGTTAEEVVILVRRGPRTTEVEFAAVAKGDTEQASVALPGPGTAAAAVLSFKEP